MMNTFCASVIRRIISFSKRIGFKRRLLSWSISTKRCKVLPVVLAALALTVLCDWRRLALETSAVLQPPEAIAATDLHYLRRNRKLLSYIDHGTEPLIEPSSATCAAEEGSGTTSLVALVTSAPHRVLNREAIRTTWAQHIPTYFFLGLPSDGIDETLVDYYVEAKQHGDIVVGDFVDAYHNLTLKTMFMVQWARRRCGHASFVFKTDDDVLVNPWMMETVLRDNQDAAMIGYLKNDSTPHRDVYSKWHLPRWLYPHDLIPQYLSGTGYLIKGDYLDKLYQKAIEVPLINLEDVYLTYLVAKESLGLNLTHDSRLNPYKPFIPISCTYWTMASIHSLSPDEMVNAWSKIKSLASDYQDGKEICGSFKKYLNFLSSENLFY